MYKKEKGEQTVKEKIPCAMTIAGSDSSGGAGIAADLKTFTALGVYGTCVITAVTAQNTTGVTEIFPIPPQIVKKQIETTLTDIPVRTAKTGMLYSKETIAAVAEAISKFNLTTVVDPVFRAGTGALLIREEAKEALTRLLVPKARVLTPNRYEAEDLAQMSIQTVEDMKRAAEKISKLGTDAVIIKGGHVESKETVTDVLYYKGETRIFTKPRVNISTHGSGCAFSAAIAAYLALGLNIHDSVDKAEKFIGKAIFFSQKIGKGRIPVNPSASLFNEAERFHVLKNVSEAVEIIQKNSVFACFVAEVGMQVGMALPYATSKEHVAAVKGRIVRYGENLKAVGCVEFGASDHIARIIITAMRHDPTKRAAINLKYDAKLIEVLKKMGFTVAFFDRKLEPETIKTVEGRTLGWGINEVLRKTGKVPDVIYDLGDVGKEPMIRLLGSSATEVTKKALKAIQKINEKTK